MILGLLSKLMHGKRWLARGWKEAEGSWRSGCDSRLIIRRN